MKQIEQYNDAASYNSAGKPTTESRVANIKEGNVSKFDGVNVPTTDTPVFGDAVYFDENGNRVAIRKEVYNRSLVPTSWTYKGVFLDYYRDGRWRVFLGNYSSLPTKKYADVVQYQLNAPTLDGEEHTATLGLWLSNNSYASATTIDYTYTATALSDVVAALNAAIDAKKAEVSFNQDVWAYLADDNNNKVSTDEAATKIIVQIDTWNDYHQYQVQGGTLIIWRDMPASDNYRKVNGKATNTRGLMNFAGAAAYWSTNGRTLDANVAVHSEAGNTSPMKLTEFQSSPYAAEIRAYYKTYEAYLRGEFGILNQMKVGAFALPDGEYLTKKYGPMMAPTKNGGTKAMFPALNWAYLEGGHLWDVNEGVLMMEDSNLVIINATQTKAGKVVLSNASKRWWAERYSVFNAWIFYGTSRNLGSSNVYSADQVGAVALLK
jgi:hypothetical protein